MRPLLLPRCCNCGSSSSSTATIVLFEAVSRTESDERCRSINRPFSTRSGGKSRRRRGIGPPQRTIDDLPKWEAKQLAGLGYAVIGLPS
jgi:hypothetical protein